METIKWIQSLLGEELQPLFLAITSLGSEYAYIVFMTLYYWLVDPWTGRQLGIVTTLSLGFNILLKDLSANPRPFELNPNLAPPAAKATADGSSFPSGHSQGSATFWFFLAFYYQRLWLWVLSITLVSLVAFSRVYLGVHFPVDVVVGLILGILFAFVGVRLSLPNKPLLLVRVATVMLAFLLAIALPDLARPLGVLVAFFLTTPDFHPPTTWKGKVLFGGTGLLLILLIHKGSSVLLGDWKHLAEITFWHYAIMTLFATEILPKFARRRY
ncbi:MAG: phosphatase PAP2 family protein [Nostocaceae cyanobacterium]|nr:phosphatase PAP2 family protein [Nostocaceae cyanobacterium]